VKLKFKRVGNRGEPLPLPFYATPGSAGFDLRADVDFILEPGERRVVPTGLSVEIPVGFELQIRPRSGLAAKEGVTVLNSPGTIDSDYRNEIGVIIFYPYNKHTTVARSFKRGDRIAQAVMTAVVQAEIVEAEELGGEDRGGGFGSTGTK
jgi:dUTP pyrophosphatase